MGKAYSKETRDAVVKARMSGMLVKDICRKFHVCDQTIRDWMKADANVVGRTSIKKPPIKVSPHVQSSRENGRFSDEDRREVVKLYHEGYSVADICKSVQIGRSTLYRWISLHTEFRRYGGEVFTSKDVFTLREENRLLREENQILHKCECHPRDALSVKLAGMAKLQEEFTIHALCRAMDVKRATFYNYLFRGKPMTVFERTDEALRPQIQELFEGSKERQSSAKINFLNPHAKLSRVLPFPRSFC